MTNWMSLRAYARHRGDALSAVQKAIATGRVSAAAVKRGDNGALNGIDQVQADTDWALNTDPVEALKNNKWPAGHVETFERGADAMAPHTVASEQVQPGMGAASPLPDGLPLLAPTAKDDAPLTGGADTKGYLDARTRDMEFRAKQSELNYLERVGVLVSADDARSEQIAICRELRDRLEQVPVRISQKLAAETDPQRIEHTLLTEIRNALNELSRAFAGAVAAGGPGECPSAPA